MRRRRLRLPGLWVYLWVPQGREAPLASWEARYLWRPRSPGTSGSLGVQVPWASLEARHLWLPRSSGAFGLPWLPRSPWTFGFLGVPVASLEARCLGLPRGWLEVQVPLAVCGFLGVTVPPLPPSRRDAPLPASACDVRHKPRCLAPCSCYRGRSLPGAGSKSRHLWLSAASSESR